MRRWAVLLLGMWSAGAFAQTAPVPLGERVRGPFDVSFKPFADAKALDRNTVGELARFGREDKQWVLVFARTELPDASPLKDGTTPEGKIEAGYLSATINKLRSTDTGADVLRNDVIDLGDVRIGVIAAATHERDKPVLMQEALMEVTPRLYYTLVMTSPLGDGDASRSPAAREAATVFKGIIDSIERVDQSAIKADQDERLFRTRGLFTQWNSTKILAALVPERYLRFKRDGRDVGYGYVVEQPANALPRAGQINALPPDPTAAFGFRVGTRTHTVTDDGRSIDVENWTYVNFNRRHEVWSKVSILSDPAAKTEKDKSVWFSELGASDMQPHREFPENMKHEDFKELDQKARQSGDEVPSKEVDRYRLIVRNEGRSAVAEPLYRDLPPFYLPGALEAILPRIVSLNGPTSYLFAAYNSETRQIMLRYVDVAPEADVTLDGKSVRAVGVSVRQGYAGPVTTHYVTNKGQYLGSVNAATKLEILPSDRPTLEAVWKDANLQAPRAEKMTCGEVIAVDVLTSRTFWRRRK